ncbi:4Fe-4S single cluster domain-containing protein [Reichenbachiella faecimaris]|uniref:4Fe-4S single cluster domain-containing protein n=1 Tax=Reichenbachiella faecimaris TaxID=692418 RepID=A0A1W2G609_REIFA|nr:twitch domain-containing radical SAM protein [Reichenbachiella faecimaris]SMD31726.1 4Fe-4S single cluster domain-containing protein [Reichenbachiella faecimaris]
MPWLHLYVDTSGRAKACCNGNITFGNINEQSIDEIWQGEPIRKFRRLLLAGEKDKRCASCFDREKAGKHSMRKETLAKFSHKMSWVKNTHIDGISPDSKPIYFDIRFNNLCNLRCRTCWHGASSSWFEEANVLKQNFGEKAIIEASKDSQSFIDQVLGLQVDIEEIYFAGGEPLMMKEHYDLLEGLIKNAQTKVHLRYNTNLSILSLKGRNVLDLWEKFDRVTVSASIDGLGKQGEYIRKGLVWEKFESNMHSIKSNLPHIKLEIAPTISIFNVLKLGELHHYFVDAGLIDINSIYINVLSRPDHFNVKILPSEVKKKASKAISQHIDWLSTQGATTTVISEFRSVIDFMNQDSWTHQLPKLKKQLKVMDEMRSENYEKIFPEFKQMLDLV